MVHHANGFFMNWSGKQKGDGRAIQAKAVAALRSGTSSNSELTMERQNRFVVRLVVRVLRVRAADLEMCR